MTDELRGRRIAILDTDGVEQVELEQPRDVVEDSGAITDLVSTHEGEIQAMHNDIDPGRTFPVDRLVDEVSSDDYDALILPGGTVNPDRLRMDAGAVDFVRGFIRSGRPVGAICHGPWTLVEADVVRGRTLTSYPSLRTDIRNAGGKVQDRQVVVDRGLVTSRNPDDLPAFCATIVEEFAAGRHPVQAGSTGTAGGATSRRSTVTPKSRWA
jgi:protease I